MTRMRMGLFKKVMFVMTLLSAGYFMTIFIVTVPKTEEIISQLEEEKAKAILSKVVAIIQNSCKELESFKKYALDMHKQELKDLTDIAWSIIKTKYDESNPQNIEQKRKEVIDLIGKLHYGDYNYFFISDYHNMVLSHPYLKGKDFSKVTDVKGNLVLAPMVKIARESGAGYYKYWWKKNNSEEKIYPKLSYVRDFPKWNMVIGTGVYLDRIDKEVTKRKKELFEKLKTIFRETKIGETGYLYLVDGEGKVLIHPDKDLIGVDSHTLTNPSTGRSMYDDLLKAAKTTQTFRYVWNKPTDKKQYVYPKISWIEYLPGIDWYVVSSAYMDEFEEVALSIERRVVFASVMLFVISLLIGSMLFRRIIRPLERLSLATKAIANGHYSKRVFVSTDDEIASLANDFNRMIEHIQEFIDTLDKKVEERTAAYLQQKKYVQAIMDSQYNIVITTNGERLFDANKAFFHFFQVPNIEVFKRTYGECISNTFMPSSKYIGSKVDGKQWIQHILEHQYKNHKALIKVGNQERVFTINAHSFEFEDTEYTTAVFTDITELQQIKEQLEEAKEKAEEAAKIKSEFLANMSHEIRTPLNGILSMTYVALRSNPDQKDRLYFERIGKSAKILLEIVNDVLDFSKLEAGKLLLVKSTFNLPELVKDACAIVETIAEEKGVAMRIVYDPSLGEFYHGDRLRIMQVLTNLVGNAVKFTEQGEVSVSVTQVEERRVRISVKDTGIGISQADQKRLFGSFLQVDGSLTRKYGGTGLGLAISKALVEMMDGYIWVESSLGKGSTFSFEIVLERAADGAIVEREEVEDESLMQQLKSRGGSRILLVEDNRINRMTVEELLKGSGIEIVMAHNGEEGVEVCQSDETIELILMDLQMPKMDGYEATLQIRKFNRDIPIIALSANVLEQDIIRTKEVGMDSYLTKPIDVQKLYKTLITYLSTKRKVEKVDTMNVQENEAIILPQIPSLDQKKALSLIQGNKRVYKKILQGLLDFKGLSLATMESEEERARLIHTIKGLSASAGATQLHTMAKALEDNLTPEGLKAFDDALASLLEILEKSGLSKEESESKKREQLEGEVRERLFDNLKVACQTKRPKAVTKALEEIAKYQLSQEDQQRYETIKVLSKKFKYKEAYKVLDDEDDSDS